MQVKTKTRRDPVQPSDLRHARPGELGRRRLNGHAPGPVNSLPCVDQEGIRPGEVALAAWFKTVKFKKALIGGVNEADVWKKLQELQGLYEEAIQAERIRYETLLAQYTAPRPPRVPHNPQTSKAKNYLCEGDEEQIGPSRQKTENSDSPDFS